MPSQRTEPSSIPPLRQLVPASSLPASFRLDGKVALVTGASRGIGEVIARALAEAGAHVVVSSRRAESVEAVAASIRQLGGSASARAIHMGALGELAPAADAIVAEHGRLDVLVNNAASSPVFGPVEDTPMSAVDKILDVNLKGPFALACAALPHLRAEGGSIVNVSSVGGVKPETGLGMYSVSKAALVSLTRVMAKEWGPDVRANVICPGLIRTDFSEPLWANESVAARFEGRLPLGRIGTSDEIAGLALFLASDASSYCTGSIFTADGGFLVA